MAVLSDYTSGTITLANGSTDVTGTGTLFDVAKFREGDTLQIENLTAVIASVNSNTSLTLTAPWTGVALTNAPYRARYLPDGARVTAQATTLIELLGNGVLSNLADLGVEDGKVPVGNAAGEYELVDKDELGIQDPNGSLGKLADVELGNRQVLQTDAAGNLTTLALAARQILQTDNDGALRALSLIANKFLHTDANGDLALSDLGASAIALLNLSGTAAANMLPYLTSTSAAGLTALTAFARTVLDDANGAAMFATMGFTSGASWFKLPSGHLVQWGSSVGTTDANGLATVAFQTSFLSATSYNAVCWNGDWNVTGILSNVRTTGWPLAGGMQVRFRNPTTNAIIVSQTTRVDWLAIGMGA